MAIEEEPQSWMPFVLYAAAIWTGLRAGELAGLRWSDVNFDGGFIEVMRSFNGKTKTPASQRYVPIQHSLRPVLVDWKERCPVTALDLVFPNKVGKMLEPSSRIFQETLHRALDDAGFERPTTGRRVHVITFHSLRHTFACWWMLSGGSLDRLVRVLGHTTKAMTEYYANVGGYVFPDDLARLDRTIGAVLTGREESSRAASSASSL